MAKQEDKAQYAPSTQQLDLEARLENGNESVRVLSTSDSFKKPEPGEGDGRDYRVEDNETDAYLGTSPEYATYANETEKPYAPEEGAENEVAAQFYESTQRFVDPVNRDDSQEVEEAGGDVADPAAQAEDEKSGSTPSTGSTSGS